MLAQKGMSTAVGDEGGFAPNLRSNEELYLINGSYCANQAAAGTDVSLALDMASLNLQRRQIYLA